MIYHRRSLSLFTLLLLVFLSGGFPLQVLGQKGTAKKPESDTSPKKGKAGTALSSEEAPALAPRVITKTVNKGSVKDILVKPNEGALAIFAVVGAKVMLTRLGNNKGDKSFDYELKDKTLSLGSMAPGRWKVIVNHEDYHPVEEIIIIQRGTPTLFEPALVPKYGSIEIVGVPTEATIFLDGQQLDPASYKASSTGLTIPKVAVGRHSLKIATEKYRDAITDLEVKPGETSPISGKLDLATVTLTINSVSGASVYVDNIAKGIVQPDGQLIIEQLSPGAHNVRVIKDGYESRERQITLSLEKDNITVDAREAQRTTTPRTRGLSLKRDNVIVDASLTPIPISSEAVINSKSATAKWFPAPLSWKFEKNGIQVSGKEVVLFKDTAEKREFNIYRDFGLDLDLRFKNGKGAAWIIRAQDLKNYYLFELATSKSEGGRKVLNFYICREGKLELKDSRRVVEDIEKPNDSFHITVEVRGNQFSHKIMVSSTPKPEPQPLATFTDDTFSIGGIGFQGVNGIEMLIQNLIIVPEKKNRN